MLKKEGLLFAFSLFFCFFTVSLGYANSNQSIPIKEYKEKLHSALRIVGFCEKGASLSPENLSQLKVIFPPEEVVAIENQVVQIKNNWILNSLDEIKYSEGKLEFRQKLRGLKKGLSLLLEEVDVASNDYQENSKLLIKEILSRKEFSERPLHPFLKRLTEWIDRKFRSLALRIKEGAEGFLEKLHSLFRRFIKYLPLFSDTKPKINIYQPLTIFLYIFLGAFALIFLIFFIRYKWYAFFLKLGKHIKVQPALKPQSVKIPPWQALKEQAEQAAKSQNLKIAFHYLYLSLLMFLEQKRILVCRESTANFEYISQLLRYPDLCPDFKQITQTFDRIWYGSGHFDNRVYEDFVSGYNQIVEKLNL